MSLASCRQNPWRPSGELAHRVLRASPDSQVMSEVTRGQLRALLQRAAELRQQMHDIRRELDVLASQLAQAGIVTGDVGDREALTKRKSAK
jgi:hypothetical protein